LSYLLFISFLIALINAGYTYQVWLLTTSCSGSPAYSYSSDGDCGQTTGSNNGYVKIVYEIGNGIYDVYQYSDAQCTSQTNSFSINQNQLNQCIASFLSSYKFQITFVCFPGESKVTTSDNRKVKLSDLKVGEHVFAYDGYGNTTTSEVFTFLDYQKDAYMDFLELHYLDENSGKGKMALSHEHLILAKRTGESHFVQAKDVKVGDYIFKNYNGSLTPVIVDSINVKAYKGAIAPTTMEGTVIVDDIVVSSYAAISHSVAHAFIAPLRLAYRISPSLVASDYNGMHPYAQTLFNMLSHYVQHPHYLYAAPTLDS